VEPLAYPRYSFGMLLEPRLLSLEHRYHAARANTHNARLHDFGTVCGLRVDPHPSKACANTYAILRPGIALDCCGHEIVVPEDLFVPLHDGAVSGWCGATMGVAAAQLPATGATVNIPVDPNPIRKETLYVCLRYAQCDTDPIPTYVRACGCCSPCEHGGCTPSVTREGYEVVVTSTAPPNYENPIGKVFCDWLDVALKGPGTSAPAEALAKKTLGEAICEAIVEPCPDICSGGNDLLLLATVSFDANGDVTGIDNVTGRRLVISTGALADAIGCLTRATIACCATKLAAPRVSTTTLPAASMGENQVATLVTAGIPITFNMAMDPKSAVPAQSATDTGTVTLQIHNNPTNTTTVLPCAVSWNDAKTVLTVRATTLDPGTQQTPPPGAAEPGDPGHVGGILTGDELTITLTGGPKGGTFAGPALRDASGTFRLDGSPATGGDLAGYSGDGTQGGDFVYVISGTL
jgi:hypothetical protein